MNSGVAKEKRLALWLPPPNDILKLNVDETALGKKGLVAGLGSILRHENLKSLLEFLGMVGMK